MSARTSPETIATLTAGLFRDRRPRTGNRVHRYSPYASEADDRRWRAANTFSRAENNARMAAAEAFERETLDRRRAAKPRARRGELGTTGLMILRKLLVLRGRGDGRLEPSVKWLARELRRAVSEVHRALTALKAHGFLTWERRSAPVEDPQPGGPKVEQITNAYFLELRDAAAAKVRQILRRPTQAQRDAAEAAERGRQARAIEQLPTTALAALLDQTGIDAEHKAALVRMVTKTRGDSSARNE